MKINDKETLSIAAAVSDVLEGKVKKEEADYPHDMWSPEGEKEVAKDEAEHKALADKGYTHDKPEVEEVAEPVAKGEKDFKAKHKVKKSGEKEDGTVVKEKKANEVLGFDKDNTHDGDAEDEKKDVKKEGNKFTMALNAARKNGDDEFVVSGKKYKVEDYDEDEDDKEEVDEGKVKSKMIDDSEKMSKKDFIKKYGKENADDLYEAQDEEVDEVSDFKKREIEHELRREKPKKGSKKPRPNKSKSMGARRTFGGPSEEVEEAVDTSLVKKAVELALKMGGDMSGATKKIEKMMKGLSKNKEVAAALQLANEEVSESVLDEAHQMNAQESKKAKYKAFFDKALMKFGVKSPAELKGDKKKEFFDYVDANYEAENETD